MKKIKKNLIMVIAIFSAAVVFSVTTSAASEITVNVYSPDVLVQQVYVNQSGQSLYRPITASGEWYSVYTFPHSTESGMKFDNVSMYVSFPEIYFEPGYNYTFYMGINLAFSATVRGEIWGRNNDSPYTAIAHSDPVTVNQATTTYISFSCRPESRFAVGQFELYFTNLNNVYGSRRILFHVFKYTKLTDAELAAAAIMEYPYESPFPNMNEDVEGANAALTDAVNASLGGNGEAKQALGDASSGVNTLLGIADFGLSMLFIQRTVGGIFNGTPLLYLFYFSLAVSVVCFLIGSSSRIASLYTSSKKIQASRSYSSRSRLNRSDGGGG